MSRPAALRSAAPPLRAVALSLLLHGGAVAGMLLADRDAPPAPGAERGVEILWHREVARDSAAGEAAPDPPSAEAPPQSPPPEALPAEAGHGPPEHAPQAGTPPLEPVPPGRGDAPAAIVAAEAPLPLPPPPMPPPPPSAPARPAPALPPAAPPLPGEGPRPPMLGGGALVLGAVSQPTPEYRPEEPRYPEGARRRGETGTVRVRLHVDERGRVARVDLLGSSGHAELDRAAQDYFARWRFRPARRADGLPVADSVTAALTWRLVD
ncbi:energy transducer TonB [Crenalkalicoccus roseus]|uniref:energy transducer TonB n=1 Tax=Crenalkalicoccus roseus TaxID=1485588 RepID=UPI001081FB95|nr:energy transducer TonB [Crenalkalicoccus roseus]